MPDWMDELRDSLAEDEWKRKEAEEKERHIDMEIGFALGQIFDTLRKSVETSIPTLNHRCRTRGVLRARERYFAPGLLSTATALVL